MSTNFWINSVFGYFTGKATEKGNKEKLMGKKGGKKEFNLRFLHVMFAFKSPC